jgi:DNA-binding NtrC family response regulator
LSEFAIRLPTLPERREDIGELFRFFCSQAAAQPCWVVRPEGLQEKVRPSLLEPTAEAIRLAEKRRFSGGLRELSCEVTVALWRASQAGRSQIDVSDLHEDPNDTARS